MSTSRMLEQEDKVTTTVKTREERVFPRYMEAAFLFTLKFLQVDFENEIKFIIATNFS